MNSVRLLELVRKAGVAINGHEELVAIEELVALVERETVQRRSARMDDARESAVLQVSAMLEALGIAPAAATFSPSDLGCICRCFAMQAKRAAAAESELTALRAERDALAKERELRMAVWKADTQAEPNQ